MSAVQCFCLTGGAVGSIQEFVQRLLRMEQKRQDHFSCFYSPSGVSSCVPRFVHKARACIRSLILSSQEVAESDPGKGEVVAVLPIAIFVWYVVSQYGCAVPAHQFDKQACAEEPWCLSGFDSSDGRSELDDESEVSNISRWRRRSTRASLNSWRWEPAGFLEREQKWLGYCTCGAYLLGFFLYLVWDVFVEDPGPGWLKVRRS